MKRLIALILTLITLFSLVACSSSLPAETATGEKTAETKQEEAKKTAENPNEYLVKGTGAITLPEGFSVGYARVDITPTTWPTLFYNGEYADSAHDPLQFTCVALSDGENVALICSVDMRSMNVQLHTKAKDLLIKSIEKHADFKVSPDNIFINNSHSHSAVDCGMDDPTVVKWKAQVFYKKLALVGEAAVRDLAPAVAYSGKSHTEGLTFVRRYFREDGAFTSIHYRETSDAPIVRHESDPDTEMRTVRFDREGDKKDVVMVNYQSHYGSAESIWPDQISADFVHQMRENAEKDTDCLFSYIAGAGGNLVFNTRINGERKYPTIVEGGAYMWDVAKKAMASEEKIATGTIRSAAIQYKGEHNHDYDQETIDKARTISNAEVRSAEQQKLINELGFHSRYQANGILAGINADYTEFPLAAISCGDLAFCAFPYEMWDTNGKECREASPFKVTFISSLTNGSVGYIPAAHAFPNGGYEVYSCRFKPGCGEEFVGEMLKLLGECKNAG